MWNEIRNALKSIMVLYLLSCFIAFVIAAGVILLPIAMIIGAVVAIKEIVVYSAHYLKVHLAPRNLSINFQPAISRVEHVKHSIAQYMKGVEEKMKYWWRRDDFTFNH